MANVLTIDTSDNKRIQIGLSINGKKEIKEIIVYSKNLKSQACLALIEKVLKQKNLKPKDLSEIKVNKGPGSFTGLRVGISIANALSFLLKIPVNGKQVGELEEPVYN